MEAYLTNREGRRLFCRREGEGPPLLLIHGAMVDADFFADAAGLLSAAFTVITYDRKGYSRSEQSDACTLQAQADDAADVLRGLADGPAIVVGCSLGATIAMKLAAQYPCMVSALLLHEPPLLCIPGTLAPEEADELEAVSALVKRAEYRKALLRFLLSVSSAQEESRPYPPEKLEIHMKNGLRFMEREFFDLFLADSDACGIPELSGRKNIYCLRGTSSAARYAGRAAAALARQIGGKLLYVPGGHNAARDMPAEFAAAIAGLWLLNEETNAQQDGRKINL